MRGFTEITERDTGIVFRFLDDLNDPSQLHIEAAHRVGPEQAIETFARGLERTVWLEQKRCFETVTDDFVLVWLWIDEAQSRVLVITCVPRVESHY